MTDDNVISGSNLAQQMLAQQTGAKLDIDQSSEEDELSRSNQVAETLTHLQNVIQRNADQLKEISEELKQRQESLRGIYENDAELSKAQDEVKQYSDQLKQRKSKLTSNPETIAIKTRIDELRNQRTEIEEALNSHLLNYYSMTNSTSIDTPDGDQREFSIKAKLKVT